MGVCLFPGDGNIESPDACFSYREFKRFRHRLAEEEGFSMPDMEGFGGSTSWNDVSSTLKPLLDHPDDHGRNISLNECRIMLPRLESILSKIEKAPGIHIEERDQLRWLSNLVTVVRICVKKNVEMCFM
ncbi:hypothetical protein [Streptomyces hydrogenans]